MWLTSTNSLVTTMHLCPSFLHNHNPKFTITRLRKVMITEVIASKHIVNNDCVFLAIDKEDNTVNATLIYFCIYDVGPDNMRPFSHCCQDRQVVTVPNTALLNVIRLWVILIQLDL